MIMGYEPRKSYIAPYIKLVGTYYRPNPITTLSFMNVFSLFAQKHFFQSFGRLKKNLLKSFFCPYKKRVGGISGASESKCIQMCVIKHPIYHRPVKIMDGNYSSCDINRTALYHNLFSQYAT